MSLWKTGRIPGQERRFALGAWLPGRGLMSPAYVPTPKARLGLRYKHPVWYPAGIVLAAGATGRLRVAVAPNFRLMMVLGQDTAANNADGQGSSQIRIFDTARRQDFSQSYLSELIIYGTASHPFILKYPYRWTGTAPVLISVQNRTAVQNTITVVLYGVSD